MPEIFFHICGWFGTLIILWAYFMVSAKKLNADGYAYPSMNLIGAVALGINVTYMHVWPALALEIVWGGIAIYALMRVGKK